MSQARFYDPYGLPIADIATATVDFFRRDGYDARYQTDYAGRTVLEISKQDTVRFILGLAYSLTVVFTPQPNGQVLLELGGESWADKVVSGAVGAFFFPPFLFTAAYGAWKQSELDDRFWDFLKNYIEQRTGRPVMPAMAVPYNNNATSLLGDDWNKTISDIFAPTPVASSPDQLPTGYQAYQNPSYGYTTPNYQQPNYNQSQQPPLFVANRRMQWFEPKTMQPLFDDNVGRMASWRAVMEDGKINYEELNEQQERVTKLQQHTEEMLDVSARVKLVEVMVELGQLEQLQRTALTNANQ